MTRNRLHRSPARRQSGFIQGTILFALAILGVIIAAFAVSNTGSSTNTDTERDRVNAGVILKAGSDLQDAFSRAMGDNWQAPDISVTLPTDPTTGTPTRLNLFDPAYKYGVQVRLPDQAFANNTAVAFEDGNLTATALGDAAIEERVVTLAGLRLNVCRRINNLVTGGPWDANATPPATLALAASTISGSEGCYNDTTDGYTYYRVVAVDSGT